MIARFGGGNNGVAEYLENGRKAEREYTRDELDYRLVLDGDLAITNSVIQSIEDKGQERYLHITLSFHESEISKDTLEEISSDYKKLFMAAFDEQEYSFYAEAHLPKIKSVVNNKTGELVERKPHIHIVIPRTNLVTGKSMNPGGDLTNEKTQILLDAIQENINNKYGLVSPKDCVRVSEDNYPNVLSRAKGDLFRERQGALKRDIYSKVESKGIKSFADFAILLKDFGEVKERNPGKENAYLAVRFNGDEKFTNLKNPLFSREYIERRELALKKPTETQIQNRLDTWINQKSLEIKYIYPSAAKRRQEYKAVPDNQKRDFLKRIDNEHRGKFRLPGERGRERGIERGIKNAARAFNPQREFGLPRMPERGLVYGLRGFDTTPPERILHDNAKRNMAEHGIKNENIRPSMRWNEHSAGRGIKTINESSVAHELLFSHLSKMAQKNEKEIFAEIRNNIDPKRFMAALQRDFNINPEQHRITKAKDGSMRIRAGERNHNASDFLTKHINLPWQEAREYLLKVYSEQKAGKGYRVEARGTNPEAAQDRFESLKESKNYLSRFVTSEKKAVYERVRQLRAELKHIRRDERDIAKGVIVYVKITSMERIEEKEKEARNFISQYHTNWNEDKDFMKALDKIRKLVVADDNENSISSAKDSHLGLKDAIQQERQAQSYIKLKDLVMERKDSKIEYLDPESKKAVFIDRGQQVIAKTDDKAAIAVMLEYAKEKYGGSLKLNGTEEFKKQCAEVAAEKGMSIIIHPDKYHQMMLDRKSALAASVEAGPQQERAVEQPASLHETNTLMQIVTNQNKGEALGDKASQAISEIASDQTASAEAVISTLAGMEKHPALADQVAKAATELEAYKAQQLHSDMPPVNQMGNDASKAFEGELNPLGASQNRFDEIRDIPSYVRTSQVEEIGTDNQPEINLSKGELYEKAGELISREHEYYNQLVDGLKNIRSSLLENLSLKENVLYRTNMSREPSDKVQSLYDLDNHIEKYQYWANISDPKHGTDLKFGTAAPLRVSLIDRIESGEVPPELFKEVKPLEQEVKDMIQEIEQSLPISEKDQAISVSDLQSREDYKKAFEKLANEYEGALQGAATMEVDDLVQLDKALDGERTALTTQYLDAARGDPYEQAHERVERLSLDLSQAIEWKIHDKERMGEDVRETLLNEYEKTHTERGLAFERDFERGEISGLSESSAREYLGAALEARTERASGKDEAKQELDR